MTDINEFPTAQIEMLLCTSTPDDFRTAPQHQLYFDLDGIDEGEERHRGRTRMADVRSKGFRKGIDSILNTRQVSLIDDISVDNIGNELALDETVIQEAFDIGRRQFLAQCIGANVILAGFMGTTELPGFYDLPNMTVFGPFEPENLKFTAAALAITSYNGPCIDAGEKIEALYPNKRSGLAQDFVNVAKHQRGFVAMVMRGGNLIVGRTVLFRPQPVVKTR